jgi:hypothetical protein
MCPLLLLPQPLVNTTTGFIKARVSSAPFAGGVTSECFKGKVWARVIGVNLGNAHNAAYLLVHCTSFVLPAFDWQRQHPSRVELRLHFVTHFTHQRSMLPLLQWLGWRCLRTRHRVSPRATRSAQSRQPQSQF